MKNLAPVALLLAVGSIVLSVLKPGIPLWVFPIPGLVAWMMAMVLVKIYTRTLDVVVYFTALTAYALGNEVTSPSHGITFSGIILLGFVFSMRVTFIRQLGYVKALWLEPTFFVSGLGLFIYGNISHPGSLASWFFPLPMILFDAVGYSAMLKEAAAFKRGAKKDYKIGLGSTAPDFSLPDENGKTVSLSEFREKQNALLLFVRGDWCPTCHIMLRTYEKNNEQFKNKNVMVIAIGPDPQGVNKQMVEKLSLSFRILADDKQEALNLYGIQFLEPIMGQTYEVGSPLPASILVDKKGTIRHLCRADRAEEFLNTMHIFSVLEKLEA